MKKKIFLILLVVLMVGVLACTAFACKTTKGGKDKDKDKDKDGTKTEALTKDAIITLGQGIDKDIAGLFAIGESQEGYVEATIGIKLSLGNDPDLGILQDGIDLKLRVGASLDKADPAKNIAVIEAKDNSADASFYFCLFVKGETIYVGQDVLGNAVTWTKLSQAKTAGLTSYVVDLVTDLLAKPVTYLDDKNVEQTRDMTKLISGFLGTTIPGAIQGLELFETTAKTNGYDLALNLEMLGSALPTLLSLLGIETGANGTVDLSGLGDLGGVVEFAAKLLLGAELSDILGNTVPEGTEYPEIVIGFKTDADSKKLTELTLSYDGEVNGKDVSFALAIENLTVRDSANSGLLPSFNNTLNVNTAKELALELAIDLKVPGNDVDATVNCVVYPDVTLSFAAREDAMKYEDGELVADTETKWLGINFTGLKGYATITTADSAAQLIATYTAEDKGFYIDLEPVYAALGVTIAPEDEAYFNGKKFFIPLDAQGMFNGYIAGLAQNPAPPEEPSSATNVKGLIEGITAGEEFALSNILGKLGDLMNALDELIIPLIFNGSSHGFTLADGGNLTPSLLLEIDKLMDYVNGATMLGQTIKIFGEDMNIKDLYTGDAAILPALAKAFGFVDVAEGEEGYEAALDAGVEKLIAIVAGFTGYTISKTDPYDGLKLTLALLNPTADASALQVLIKKGADTVVDLKVTLGIKGVDTANRVMHADAAALKEGAIATAETEEEGTTAEQGALNAEALFNLLKNIFNFYAIDDLDMEFNPIVLGD